jgi:hypothetical protein
VPHSIPTTVAPPGLALSSTASQSQTSSPFRTLRGRGRVLCTELFLLFLVLLGFFLLSDPVFEDDPRKVTALSPVLGDKAVKPGQQGSGDPNADYDGIGIYLRCHSVILHTSKFFVNTTVRTSQ